MQKHAAKFFALFFFLPMNPQCLPHKKCSNVKMDGLGMGWGACSAHFTALAVGYTPEIVHGAMTIPNPTLAKTWLWRKGTRLKGGPAWPINDASGARSKLWANSSLGFSSRRWKIIWIQELGSHMSLIQEKPWGNKDNKQEHRKSVGAKGMSRRAESGKENGSVCDAAISLAWFTLPGLLGDLMVLTMPLPLH